MKSFVIIHRALPFDGQTKREGALVQCNALCIRASSIEVLHNRGAQGLALQHKECKYLSTKVVYPLPRSIHKANRVPNINPIPAVIVLMPMPLCVLSSHRRDAQPTLSLFVFCVQ